MEPGWLRDYDGGMDKKLLHSSIWLISSIATKTDHFSLLSASTTSNALSICTLHRPRPPESVCFLSFVGQCQDLSPGYVVRWWDFGADSYVVSIWHTVSATSNHIISMQNTNKHIRLTRPVSSQMVLYPLPLLRSCCWHSRMQGWLWSRLPITAANFVVELEFKIHGESTHLFGDGMAIWVTKGRAEPGPVFGNVDKFEGLGIFLDTSVYCFPIF